MVDQLGEPGLEELLVHLRDVRGADFTGYKRPSLSRLIARRMHAAGVADHQGYVDLLQVQPDELQQLLDTLLVNVTAFYRDQHPWEALRADLLPEVLAALDPDEPVRVWSAACATGEEAYTLAMLLHGVLGDAEYKRRVKVYATDVDDHALAQARSGRYTTAALTQLPEGQRDTYFEADGVDTWRFRTDLRPTLIFGRHDLLRDAPISRVALLSCRNALMYFQSDSQRAVLERFAFALHEHGLLLLGKAEMLLTQSQLFVPVDLPLRIFRPRRSPALRLAALAVGAHERDAVRRAAEAAFVAATSPQLVIDADGTVALLNHGAERDLGLHRDDLGRPFHELELSYRPLELRGPVAAVRAGREPVLLRDVEWLRPDAATWWDVRVAPLVEGDDVLGVHVVFEDVTARHELQERLERAHDELSTAYEELQSSSEELETMNEELQSTNEELQTVNDELRERTVDVDQANVFLQGILEGLEVAVAVVDLECRVQLWNGAAEELTGLRTFEIEGLPLAQARTELPPQQLADAVARVLDGTSRRTRVEHALSDRFGVPRLRRLEVSPLLDREHAVVGAVVTLRDDPR